MGPTWVAIAAIVLSALTFVASQRELGRKGRAAYLVDLEKRVASQEKQIDECARRLEECERDRRDLHDENFRLMQRVLRLEEDRK